VNRQPDCSTSKQCPVEGVIYRNAKGSQLVECVREVAANHSWVQEFATPIEVIENEDAGVQIHDRLTPKELRIVALLVQGYKNKEIGSQLGISEQGVKTYMHNVYQKIGVLDRLGLTLFSIQHRLVNEATARKTDSQQNDALLLRNRPRK
jgi:DNA-binding NarL/FixJ family response regulator